MAGARENPWGVWIGKWGVRTGVRSAPYRLNMYICCALFTRLRNIKNRKKGSSQCRRWIFWLVWRQKRGSFLSILFGCGHDIRFAYKGNIRNFRFFNYHVAYKFKGFCIDVKLVRVRTPLGQYLYSDRLRNRSPDIGMHRWLVRNNRFDCWCNSGRKWQRLKINGIHSN
jgi:hypothetical protein